VGEVIAQQTVLVVDDDVAVHTIVSRVLEVGGYRVLTAANGDEAMVHAGRHPVDLLLVDKQMPGMNGFEVIEAVRRLRPDVAVVMMTAYPERLAIAGAELDGYLPKPFRGLKNISATVEQALAARQRRALRVQLQQTMESLKRT